MSKINEIHINEMSLADIVEMIDLIVERSDALEAPNLAFLLSLAAEGARDAAGLPPIAPPSHYETYPTTADPLDTTGKFELE